MMADTLIKSEEQLIRECLEADGWTKEQITMFENDPDAIAAMLSEFD